MKYLNSQLENIFYVLLCLSFNLENISFRNKIDILILNTHLYCSFGLMPVEAANRSKDTLHAAMCFEGIEGTVDMATICGTAGTIIDNCRTTVPSLSTSPSLVPSTTPSLVFSTTLSIVPFVATSNIPTDNSLAPSLGLPAVFQQHHWRLVQSSLVWSSKLLLSTQTCLFLLQLKIR